MAVFYCPICGEVEERGHCCDPKKLQRIEQARKNASNRGPAEIGSGKTFDDKLRDAELLRGLNDDKFNGRQKLHCRCNR